VFCGSSRKKYPCLSAAAPPLLLSEKTIPSESETGVPWNLWLPTKDERIAAESLFAIKIGHPFDVLN